MAISKHVTDIIGVPKYYTDEYNSTPMKNFWAVIEPLLDVFGSGDICEIGSERGLTSAMISETNPDKKIHIVDPFVHESVKERENVVAHCCTSVEFLKKGLAASFYLVDGDHNYETVSDEINGIVKNWDGSSPICAVFHDVGWPFARRDGYYNSETVREPHESHHNIALVLEHEDFANRGWENGTTFGLTALDPNKKMGVLTAIEDFVSENEKYGWRYVHTPIFYGLGILWNEKGLTDEDKKTLNGLINNLEKLQPILAIAEVNRLRLIQGMNEISDDLRNTLAENERLKQKLGKVKLKKLRKILDDLLSKKRDG